MMDTSAIRNQRGFPRQQTIEFAPDLQRPPGKPDQLIIPEHHPEVDSGVERNPQSPGFGTLLRPCVRWILIHDHYVISQDRYNDHPWGHLTRSVLRKRKEHIERQKAQSIVVSVAFPCLTG